jgi:SOS-response transcriptional repressor LexA
MRKDKPLQREPKPPRSEAGPVRGEDQTESYIAYDEGTPRPVTQSGAKNNQTDDGSDNAYTGAAQSVSGVSVHNGFPNPAADSLRATLDLNRLLIKHPAGTYFMRIEGENWNELGIFSGDIAIVDRVPNPIITDLVVWWEGERFAIGHLSKLPDDTPYWGIITNIIHQYRY